MHDPNQPGCDDSARDLSLRHVPTDDRPAPDAPAPRAAHPWKGGNTARVQRVRACRSVATVDVARVKKRSGQRISRSGKKGEVLFFDAVAGPRYYARVRDVRLGTFSSLETAEAAIAAYVRAEEEANPLQYHQIVDDWITDITDAFPDEQRREWFGKPWDPIAASMVRMGFDGDLTLEQAARLYGVSRQRIAQVEIVAVKRCLKELGEYAGHEPHEAVSPLGVIEGGVW